MLVRERGGGVIGVDGLADSITEEALGGLSPYPTEHINRFGSYVLDLARPPEPLPFAIPPPRARRSPGRLSSNSRTCKGRGVIPAADLVHTNQLLIIQRVARDV